MKPKITCFCHSFSLLSEHTFLRHIAILVILIFLLSAGCVERKMSLKEAKEVAVSMEGKSFVPPPRHIEDVITLLNLRGDYDLKAVEKVKTAANMKPPKTESSSKLGDFYIRRGVMRGNLGRYKQALDDIRRGLKYWDGRRPFSIDLEDFSILMTNAGVIEAENGNFSRGIDLIHKGIAHRDWPMAYNYLMESYILTGDFKAADENMEKGLSIVSEKMNNPYHSLHDLLRIWQASLLAGMLEAKGMFAEAESHRRAFKRGAPKLLRDNQTGRNISIPLQPGEVVRGGILLAINLVQQGRLTEAEMVGRETLKESIGLCGKNSVYTGKTVGCLADIRLAQGRIDDAEKLGHARIRLFKAAGLLNDSKLMGEAKSFLGDILTIRRNFNGAIKQYDMAGEGLAENQYYFDRVLARNPNRIISQLKTGRTDQAIKSITDAYGGYREFVGVENYTTAELLALKGMALISMKRDKEALNVFSKAVPLLLNGKSGIKLDYLRKKRRLILIETYLDLLKSIHESRRNKEFGINASNEAFKLVGAMYESAVNDDLRAFMARAAASRYPELSELVRKEQDLLRQSGAAQVMLVNAVIAPDNEGKQEIINTLKASLDKLKNSRIVLLEEINAQFPQYANFINPGFVTMEQARKYLKHTEVLISTHSTENQTYVWAVPQKGQVQFEIVPLGRNDLQKAVNHLRMALDPKPETFGDIPEFDLAGAHELYTMLLKPVEKGWKDAKDLIIIASGALGQLPFAVLPTASVRLDQEKSDLFSKYRKIPWLIRQASITRMPSISSFIALRSAPEGGPNRKAFAGFGDPLFNRKQLARAGMKMEETLMRIAGMGGRLDSRGIRLSEAGDLDNKGISSIRLEHLNRLPDTAEEIKSIALALGADPLQDIFLGDRASERQVKTMNLSDRRVIAFASHALVPGDLDGLVQPAIALSAPSVTGDNDDGLLTMGEILKLKLNADWVVLSACNTGAADGAGAEAVSGLGRAFFYAGTRALLVSMWPVETTSAKTLTTGLFQYQKEDNTLSRARAHQKSMLDLMDNQVLKNDATGKIIVSYAHPIFWAPFIVVGDGG